MSSIYRQISLDLDPMYILFYRIILKDLGDITFTILKNKCCSVFLSKKKYLDEGTDIFTIELLKFDR